MTEQIKLQRMLEMLIMMGHPYGRTKKGLAEHFDLSEKTIGRYITTFKDVGFVVESNDGYFKINKEESHYKDLSQLLYFSQEESFVLRRAIEEINVSDPIKEELTHKLYSLYNYDRVATPAIKTDKEKKINAIEHAIKEGKQIWLIKYSSGHSDTISDRLVEPFDFTHNFRGLWAWDMASKSNKIFVLERFDEVEITTNSIRFESLHKKQLPDVFRMTGEEEISVKIKLNLRAYNLLVEEYPLAQKETKKCGDSNYMLETKVKSTEGVRRFVMGLIQDLEIIEPESLKEEIKELFEGWIGL